MPGELTWEVASRLVDEIVTVTDEQIVEAMRFAFERMKLVVEPSGAVGIAAVLNGLVEAPTIGIVVSGGNVAADRFAELLARLRTPPRPDRTRRRETTTRAATVSRRTPGGTKSGKSASGQVRPSC